MNNIQLYIKSIKSPDTAKVARFVLDGADADIEKFSLKELERYVLSLEPNCPKAIITICYVLGAYSRWLQEQGLADDSFCKLVGSLDKKSLWKKAKPRARKKFISNKQYLEIIREIEAYEEYNPLYYKTLFQCVYEGIYCDDMSVIKNLTKSDINGNLVTLHEDNGHTYKIKVSKGLSSNLIKLAEKEVWKRPNRYGICKVKMRGFYRDSIFKVENRSTASDKSFKFVYYSKLRKISDDYLGYYISPFQLYISGMMCRIKTDLEKKGISLEEAFAENCRNKIVYEIISKELIRCNYTAGVGNFREIVNGNLDAF